MVIKKKKGHKANVFWSHEKTSLEKTLILGQVQGSRKNGRPNRSNSIKEATVLSLQDLRMAVNDRMFQRTLIQGINTSEVS